MIITYQGGEFFKLQFGDTILAFNPISKESKLKSSRFGADIAFISLDHKDFNGVENLEFGEKKPFIISGPGEYEIKGIFIKGFASSSNYDGKKGINTIYLLSLDSMNICFLGALDGEIDKETMESLDNIDVLFTPIGGDGTLDASASYKLAVKLEPRLIIPMQYDEKSDALKKFLKEGGEEKMTSEEKLSIKKKDLEGKEGDIVVLASQS